MKTNVAQKYLLGSLAVAVLSFAPALKAGPGIATWQNVSGSRAEPKPPSIGHAIQTATPCADAKLVQITETRNEWPNARGPVALVATGSKIVCTSCAPASTVVMRGWSNGKGPLVTTKFAGKHECITCGTTTKI